MNGIVCHPVEGNYILLPEAKPPFSRETGRLLLYSRNSFIPNTFLSLSIPLLFSKSYLLFRAV